jgi:cytochrome c
MSARFAHERNSRSLMGGALGLCWLIGIGCAVTQLGATPGEVAQAQSQFGQGANVFANECAKCHGQRGQGIGSASAVLGPGALPEYPSSGGGASDMAQLDPQLAQIEAQSRPAGASWRDPFQNAQDLFTFISTHMPKGHASEMKPQDDWAVVSFMLAAQGATLPPAGIGPANASSIRIPRR